ncbi:MAG: redoxin domain-containing protein [Phycisphaerales bacterium]
MLCCSSNVALPVIAGLAVAVGAFGFAAVQPETGTTAGGCCGGAATAAATTECCASAGECATACATGCESELAKGPVEDPQPEPGSAVVGEAAPDFALYDLEGNRYQLSDFTENGQIVVLEWFNPECPFVVKQYERTSTMLDTYAYLMENTPAIESDSDAAADEEPTPGVVWLAINSGREGHPTADAELNTGAHENWEMPYPILMDPTGVVGRAYDAKTTPHMYIISAEGTLIYAGAIDNNRSAREAGDVNYVIQAFQQHMAGETITDAETQSYGCSVKY